MEICGGCKRGLRSLISNKLGACPMCVRAAFLGTLLSWPGAVAVVVWWPHPAFLGSALLVAAVFTFLFAAHMVAFTARLVAVLRKVRVFRGDGALLSHDRYVGRRALVTLPIKAAAAMLFGSALVLRTEPASANACRGRHKTRDEPGATQGPEVFCATEEDAGRLGSQIQDLEGTLFAYDFCQQFRCPPGAFCIPVQHEGIGGCLKLEQPGCWECEHTVIVVRCDCVPRPDGISPADLDRLIRDHLESQIEALRDRLN